MTKNLKEVLEDSERCCCAEYNPDDYITRLEEENSKLKKDLEIARLEADNRELRKEIDRLKQKGWDYPTYTPTYPYGPVTLCSNNN